MELTLRVSVDKNCSGHVIHHFHLCEQKHITRIASQRTLVTMVEDIKSQWSLQ